MVKKRYYLIGAALIVLLSSFFMIRINGYVDSQMHLKVIMQSTYANTLNQALFSFLLTVFGFALLYCFKDILRTNVAIILAPIVGTFLWAFFSIIILCLRIPYTGFVMISCLLLVLAVCIIVKKLKLKEISISNLGIILAVYFAFALVFSVFDFLIFSEDTYTHILLGKALARESSLNPNLIEEYSAIPLMTASIFTPGEFFNFSGVNGLFTLFGFSFIVSICYCIFIEISKVLGEKKSLLVSGSIFLILLTSNLFTMIAMFYPMSNSLANCALFFTVYFAYKAQKEDRFIYFSMFFLICFIWTRTESILIACGLIFFFTNMKIKKKPVIICTIGCACALLLWYVTFFSIAGLDFSKGVFLTIERSGAVVVGLLMLIAYITLSGKVSWIEKNRNRLDYLPFAVIILCLGLFTFLNPQKLITNIKVIFANLSLLGLWGFTFIILLAAMVIYYSFIKTYDIWDKTLWFYLLGLFFIFLFRVNDLRLGLGDSGNRLLLAIVPFIVFMISTRLIPKLLSKQDGIQSNK